jgi:flagellar hook-associated protein 3 FlgL
MRVTANTFPDSLVEQLRLLQQRQYRLQHQAATGQRISLPEDDPTAMRRVLDLQAEGRSWAQYQRNATVLKEQAQAIYQVIRELKTVCDRAREIAVLADGTRSPDELRAYAAEVTGLIQQAVQSANRTFGGDYLLSGTRTDRPPFVLTTDANGRVTAVTYQGNQAVPECEIAPGVTVAARPVGANPDSTGPAGLLADARAGADLLNHLIALQNHLLAGDLTAIADTDRALLARDEQNLLVHATSNGLLQARLQTAIDAARQQTASLEGLVSNQADADLAETLVRLAQTQTAYQAALQSGAQLLQSSLLDYLH